MSVEFKVGKRYNWKNQPERLIYIGRDRCWHQFVKVDDPTKVWCEVLTEDLQKLEKRHPSDSMNSFYNVTTAFITLTEQKLTNILSGSLESVTISYAIQSQPVETVVE